jgi:hypothetical protein
MSKLSRRSLVTSAAALPALAVPAAISTAAPDDTLERIAEHRRITHHIEEELCDREEHLREALAGDRCKAYSIYDRGTDVGRDDDPRWTAFKAEWWAASDRRDEIAWSFVDRPPTTIEGAATILAYADEHEEGGNQWPDSRHHFTAAGAYAGKTEEDWRKSLNRAIVPALRSAPTAAGVWAMPKAGATALSALVMPAVPAISPVDDQLVQLAREAIKLSNEFELAHVTGDTWNAIDAIGDQLVNTLDAIKNTRATSLRGLVAKARVADLEYRADGNVHSDGPHDAWMVVDDLLAMGGSRS